MPSLLMSPTFDSCNKLKNSAPLENIANYL